MPKIQYESKNFRPAALELIRKANEIIKDYDAQGFSLTLRQLYYQFVSRGWIPNTEKSYKNVGGVINDGRMAGLIDWNAIEDRTRTLRGRTHWDNPCQIVEACVRSYLEDKWANQPQRIEVWVEKDALRGVIEGVCNELDVPYLACRGYVSQSEMWEAGWKRIKHKSTTILYLGDHDPSGIDMTRDVQSRLSIFSNSDVEVKRLALNMDQVEQYNPPPNPAKVTDSRANDYISKFGEDSWELDALEPNAIVQLIRDAVLGIRDEDLWQESVDEEQENLNKLKNAADTLKGEL